MHITRLELRAVVRLVETFGPRLAGHRVRLLCDNQAVVHIINEGTSRSPVLMGDLRYLRRLLDGLQTHVSVEYIRSEDNVRADALSRVRDEEDWRIRSDIFKAMCGDCTIDRFASSTNHQLPTFNSRWPCPGSAGTDAFAQSDWREHVNYCNPPWSLLSRLASLLQANGAAAKVLAPAWRHTVWYQALRVLSTRVQHLGRAKDLFQSGRTLQSPGFARWGTDLFTIERRAPRQPFGSEFPDFQRFLEPLLED